MNTNALNSGGDATRTFNLDELSVLVRALLAVRPHLDEDERNIANGIIQDGWSA